MDPVTLAGTVTTLLIPYITQTIGGSILEDVVTKIWDKVVENFKNKPAASGVAGDFESKADDPDNQEAFALQLRKALKEDPKFMNELADLVEKMQESGLINNRGNRLGNINNTDSSNMNIIIGDGNVISETPDKFIKKETRRKNGSRKK